MLKASSPIRTSGVIGLGLSAATLGVAMSLPFVFSLGYAGWYEGRGSGNGIGMLSFLAILVLLLRISMDTTYRERFLQRFIVAAGILASTTLRLEERSEIA
jgi:hypothetical protein